MKPASRRQNTQTKASNDARSTITVKVVKSRKKATPEKQKVTGVETAILSERKDCGNRISPIRNSMVRGAYFSKKVIAEAPRPESLLPVKSNPRYKLQLFPIDDITCKGLLQDGHNPHLELTLGERKKISSVVKHLDGKWGSSRVATGELRLFPFDASVKNVDVCVSWSLKDVDTNANDVYRFLGNPVIFRLRYGWLPYIQPHTPEVNCTENQGMMRLEYNENVCVESSHGLETFGGSFGVERWEFDATEKEMEQDTDKNDAFSWLDGLTNMSFGDVLDRVATSDDYQTNQLPQENNPADGLTNISFADLLDKVGASDDCQRNQLPEENNPCFQPLPFSCDSFDAAIASHIARQQSQIQPSTRLSSILDAEETCHHFPLLKRLREVPTPRVEFLSSSKQDDDAQESAFVSEGVEHISVTANVPLTDDFDMESGTQDDVSAEITNDHCTQGLFQALNDNSVGLSGINWDSLGPLDFGCPDKPFGGAESIDLSNLLANS